ncbi:MAG: CPBP family glutamic-type intramembrane protease [Planctomycetota bacterium]
MPAFLAGMPEVPFRPFSVMVPLLGPSLGIREVLLGNDDYLLLTLALVSGVTFALLLLESALRGFCAGHELLLDEGPTSRPRELGRAWFLVLCSMLLLFTLGPAFQDQGPAFRVALPQLLFVLLPALLLARWLGIPAWREARYPLDNGAARPCKPWIPSLLRGLAAGPAILLASSALAGLQEAALPMPAAFRHAAGEALAGFPMSVPVLVLLLGVLPALSEELLYRRLFLSRLLLVHTTRRALVLSACCFALHHLSLWRFLPSLVGGLVLGGLVLRTGRLAPAVLAHALSNALAALVVLPGSPGEGSELATVLLSTDPAPAKLAIAIGLGVLALAGRKRWRLGIQVPAPALA